MEESGEHLFNLREDPGEQTDVKKNHADIMDSMKQKYSTWEKGVLPAVTL
jgi:hypothetical protein